MPEPAADERLTEAEIVTPEMLTAGWCVVRRWPRVGLAEVYEEMRRLDPRTAASAAMAERLEAVLEARRCRSDGEDPGVDAALADADDALLSYRALSPKEPA